MFNESFFYFFISKTLQGMTYQKDTSMSFPKPFTVCLETLLPHALPSEGLKRSGALPFDLFFFCPTTKAVLEKVQ